MSSGTKHTWTFRARFRRHAFGWRSQPAIKRIKEAVSEIKKAARKDPVLGGEEAVLFLEKGYEEGCTRGATIIKAQSIQIEPFW
jgi:hypothetical protein